MFLDFALQMTFGDVLYVCVQINQTQWIQFILFRRFKSHLTVKLSHAYRRNEITVFESLPPLFTVFSLFTEIMY